MPKLIAVVLVGAACMAVPAVGVAAAARNYLSWTVPASVHHIRLLETNPDGSEVINRVIDVNPGQRFVVQAVAD